MLRVSACTFHPVSSGQTMKVTFSAAKKNCLESQALLVLNADLKQHDKP